MSGRYRRIASINQDRGIDPHRKKGAAIHLTAMREAFSTLGHDVVSIDARGGTALTRGLVSAHAAKPLEVIYERYALGCAAGARFARAHGIPLVVEANAPLADEQRQWRSAIDETTEACADAVLFNTADLVVAVSSSVARYAILRGARSEKVIVEPNGIDERRFNLRAGDSPPAGLSIAPGDFVLGFHGRVRPWHGFERLVRTCRTLAQQHPVHLLAVGEGDLDALKLLADGQYTHVPWCSQAEVARYVARFDALALTYDPALPCYFSPLKLMEAMACAVVPVVPDLGDLPGSVQHMRTGLIYATDTRDHLAQMLDWLIRHPKSRSTMGAAAAEYAARHTWKRVAMRVLEHLSESSLGSGQQTPSEFAPQAGV